METTGSRSVLVVDDEAPLRRVLARGLVRAGYRVLEAADGREAEACALADAVEVLVVDLGLPREDGRDVADRIVGLCPTIAFVLFTSGNDDPGDLLPPRPARFLKKPFAIAELIEILRVVGCHP